MDYGEARKRAHSLTANAAVVALLSAEEWSGSATQATVAATALGRGGRRVYSYREKK